MRQRKDSTRVARTAAELAAQEPGKPCPKCKQPAMYYRNLGPIGREVCRACGWIEF